MNKPKHEILDEMQLKYGRKDLSFNCWFEWNNDFWVVNCEKCSDGNVFAFSCSGDMHSLLCEPEEKWLYKYKKFNSEELAEIKIIGHPLTLSDVLFNSPKGLLVDRNGIFYEPETLKPLNLGAAWAMKFNLVRDQGERCIRFISKFLNLKNDD